MRRFALFLAVAALAPIGALADDNPQQDQAQCAAAYQAKDDRTATTACQKAAIEYALIARKQSGEARYASELQEADDIVDFSASEADSGNVEMAQRDAAQARRLFEEIANLSQNDTTVSSAKTGMADADRLIDRLDKMSSP